MNARWMLIAVLGASMCCLGADQENGKVSRTYQALKCPAPSVGSAWAILNRNGANVEVEPYLSSLGNGESGTGVITSPPFIIKTDTITFTICGHDGQSGGRGENYVALVDARKGNVLMRTPPPQSDAMQERSWDVSGIRNWEVRIELHDGNAGGGFAWMGVGRIDAGPSLHIDFRQGMPEGWDRPARLAKVDYEPVAGGVPFMRVAGAFTLMPKAGSVDIPCGFAARRLFLLGGTVTSYQPLKAYGSVAICYENGSSDVFPLMGGFTLDGAYKRLSPSEAMHLHASGDPYQHYLAIRPRDATIEKIRLTARPEAGATPRITAVTCETSAESVQLMPLPKTKMEADEAAWIKSHTLSSDDLGDLGRIRDQIRQAHRMPPPTTDSSEDLPWP
jgi:hypothetical protein